MADLIKIFNEGFEKGCTFAEEDYKKKVEEIIDKIKFLIEPSRLDERKRRYKKFKEAVFGEVKWWN